MLDTQDIVLYLRTSQFLTRSDLETRRRISSKPTLPSLVLTSWDSVGVCYQNCVELGKVQPCG